MTRLFALALACFIGVLAVPAIAAADEAEPLFDPAAVAEIDFVLPLASLQKLEEEPETSEYQHAEITVKAGGQTYNLADVGFRLKGGHGSFRDLSAKAAFKVKFKEFGGPKLLGLKKLTLNNMVQDPSMVHETMVYELFREMGVPAPRTGYAFVRINGEPYGVYLNVETYDDVMLPRFFPSTQHLYEADAPGVDVRPGEADTFEVDEGDDEDLSDLEALIAAAADTVGDWSDGMEAVADLDEMTQMWAIGRYAGHWDGYAGTAAPFRPNNYYLHSLNDGIFAMLPWGTDQTWEVNMEFDEPAGGLLFNNCVADAGCEALYEAQLGQVASAIPGLDLDRVAICTADLLAPWQEEEDPLRAEYDAAEIEEGVADARSFMAQRPAELATFLGAEPPTGVPDGTDPCPKPDEPEETDKPTEPPVLIPPPGPPSPVLHFGATKLKGRTVFTRVEIPAAGTVTQKVTARIDGRRVQVCSDTGTRAAAVVKVHCQLSKAAQEERADGPLKLRVRVGFDPEQGRATFRTRTLTAPKHG
ncbi:MAG TPA: CotH kinase family protein [Solirubrobacterales bacterium]